MHRVRSFLFAHKTLFLSLGFLVLFSFTVSYATPPTSPYGAGATLNPTCAPGSTNCTVTVGSASQWDTVTGGINYAGGKVGIGTTTPAAKLDLEGDGAILAVGTVSTGTTVPNLGAGTRMMWIPSAGAFRAGNVSGTQWNAANVGVWSVAFGQNNIASGGDTAAIGFGNTASGLASIAIGHSNVASGDDSLALGTFTTASAISATAFGKNTTASGSSSTAFGRNSTASGTVSVAFGDNSTASGPASTAFGSSQAVGYYTTAFGYNTTALGDYSTAFGNSTTSRSYASTVFGSSNVGGGDAVDWISTDPLFEIGNGDPNAVPITPSDALLILKNGNTAISGSLQINGGLAQLDAAAADGTAPYVFDTSIAHTTGNIFEVRQNNSPLFIIDSSGNVTTNGSTVSSGRGSFAGGNLSTVSANYSFAFGDHSTASGVTSFAVGDHNTAADDSTAIGYRNTASGFDAVALGDQNTASGFDDSFAFGYNNVASGKQSMALGFFINDNAAYSVAVGINNIGGGDPLNWVSSDPLFEVGSGMSGAGIKQDAIMVLKNSNVGLGLDPTSPKPSYALQVGRASISGIVARFQNSTGTCDINPTTTALVCSSDMTLKKNITAISDNSPWSFNSNITVANQSILNDVLALNPVNYNWNSEADGTQKHPGFIAQDVQQVFPELVSTDPTTHLLSLNYTGLIPYTVEAIKEMNVTLQAIPTSTDPTFAQAIATFLKGIAQNGEAIVNKVTAKQLCLNNTCINEAQLQQLLQLQAQLNQGTTTSASSSNAPAATDAGTQTQQVTPIVVTPDALPVDPAPSS